MGRRDVRGDILPEGTPARKDTCVLCLASALSSVTGETLAILQAERKSEEEQNHSQQWDRSGRNLVPTVQFLSSLKLYYLSDGVGD